MPQVSLRLTKAQKAKVRKARMKRAFKAFRRLPARPRKSLALQTHNFVERCQPQKIVVANESAAVGLFRSFTLSQCLQVGSYAALFEMYKINKVIVEFRYKGAVKPAYTTIDGTGTQNNEIVNEINPILYFKVDHNDITADSLATMKQSMRTREHQISNSSPNFTITLKPAIQAEAYKTALTSAYRPKWGQWLSMNDDTVPHYGLKVYAVAGQGNNPNMGEIEVQTKIYFSAKNNE